MLSNVFAVVRLSLGTWSVVRTIGADAAWQYVNGDFRSRAGALCLAQRLAAAHNGIVLAEVVTLRRARRR